MLIHISSAKCIGIDAVPVTVEIDIDKGIGIHLVGLADIAVKESLLRTTTALESLGFRIPGKKIIINLAPADLRKNGSGYDLPIAAGIIAASGQMELPRIGDYLMMGELGLDASVRGIPGALPIAELAARSGAEGVILPFDSALEAMEMPDIRVYGVRSLREALQILSGEESSQLEIHGQRHKLAPVTDRPSVTSEETVDFADIIGQEGAKRAAEIAAAGGHNMLMIGAPGSGKSSLAKAIAGILPPMSREESLVTSKVYSVSGRNAGQYGLIRRRPFRTPHHSASMAAIIGGGAGDNIQPGEVSLANGGVLFLDELAHMPRSILEALRAPLEDRVVSVSRLKNKISFPASFMLIAASNPCPCGYYGEGDRCSCTPAQRQAYLSRLSGPIMDRIDIQVWMHPVDTRKLVQGEKAESSAAVASRVLRAREIQAERFKGDCVFCNAEMGRKQMDEFCRLSPECKEQMEQIIERSGFSARAYSRIVKLARTIADLEGSPEIKSGHLYEAAGYRFLDKLNGGKI